MADIYPNIGENNNTPQNNQSNQPGQINTDQNNQSAQWQPAQTQNPAQPQTPNDAPFITEMPEMPKNPVPPSVEPAKILTENYQENYQASEAEQNAIQNEDKPEPPPLELNSFATPVTPNNQSAKNEPLILDTEANPVNSLEDAEHNQPATDQTPVPQTPAPQTSTPQTPAPQATTPQTQETKTPDGIKLQELPKSIVNPPSDIPVKHNTPEIPRIRTYADDVKNAMATDQVSMAKIAMAEQQRRETQQKVDEVSSRNPKNIALLIASFALIILSAGVVWYFIFGSNQASPNPIILTPNKNFIQYENKESLEATNLNSSGIKDAIKQIKSIPTTLRTIKAIEFTTGGSTFETRHWLEQIGARIPDNLSRALKPEFLYGIYSDEFGPSSFIVLQVDSFEQGYSGMLAWENTLPENMEGFVYDAERRLEVDQTIPVTPEIPETETSATTSTTSQTAQQTTTATTSQTNTSSSTESQIAQSTSTTSTSTSQNTSTSTQPQTAPLNPPTNPLTERVVIPSGVFKDTVLANRDARVFETANGPLFFYAFISNDIIFIGQSETTLREFFNRYQRELAQ